MSLGRKIFLLKPTLIYLIRKSSFILLYAHLSWLLNLKIYKLKENSPINRRQKSISYQGDQRMSYFVLFL